MNPEEKSSPVHFKAYLDKILFLLFFLIATSAFAQSTVLQTASLTPTATQNALLASNNASSFENLEKLAQIAREFLIEKTKHLEGKKDISVTPLDQRLQLSACDKPIAYLSQGARTWGKTTVALRCETPQTWRIMVKAEVKIYAPYLTAAKVLPRGHLITDKDLVLATGDITAMRVGVLTDKHHAIGHTVKRTIQPGSAIWADQLKTPQIIQQGQSVTVISQGKGFRISSDGHAMNNASSGQIAKVKMPNGKIVKGIAKSDGIIEVFF